MIVYTNREIYSYGSGKKTKSERQAQMKDTSKEVASLSRKENKAKRQNEKERIKNEKALDRQSLKEERGKKREENKSNRQGFFKKIRAKINAKRLIRLRDKTGKVRILYPLTRLKRNKDNKLVKTYPNGQETEVSKENVVILPPSSQNSEPVIFDRMEIAKVNNIAPTSVTPQFLQGVVSFIPSDTSTSSITGTNTIPVIPTPEGNIEETVDGIFLKTDTESSESSSKSNVADNSRKEGNGSPTSAPMSLTKKILIASGITIALSAIGFFIYKAVKNK